MLADQALARCLQSIVAMTYLSRGQQSDSRRIYILKARGVSVSEQGRKSGAGDRAALDLGTSGLVRWKSRPAYPESANPVLLGVKRIRGR